MDQNFNNNNNWQQPQQPQDPQQPYGQQFAAPNPAQPAKKPVMATIALVLGIVSIVFGCCGSGFPFGIAGIVLSVLSNKKQPNSAKTSLILSIVGLVLSVIMFIIVYAVYFSALMMY